MISGLLSGLTAVFTWLLEASWQASVLVALVLLLQVLFRRRLNPRWHHALWLLVILRLLLPALPESALSLFQFTPAPPPAVSQSFTAPLFITTPASPAQNSSSAPAIISVQPEPISLCTLLALVWLADALGFLTLTGYVNHRFAQHVKNAPLLDDPRLLEIAAAAQAELGLRRKLRLIESPRVHGPAIMGLLRPTLILPENARAKFTDQELRFIFLHEFAHLKRGDLLLQALVALLQILHWFNPVLWYAFRRMRADREPATDALVLSRTGEAGREPYGHVLLKLLTHYHQRHSIPTLVGILEDKDQFKRRFLLIGQFTRGAYGWSLLGVLLIAALAVLGLTARKSPNAFLKDAPRLTGYIDPAAPPLSPLPNPAPLPSLTAATPRGKVEDPWTASLGFTRNDFGPPSSAGTQVIVIGGGSVRVQLLVEKIDEKDYQAHRAEIDAALLRGDHQALERLVRTVQLSSSSIATKWGEPRGFFEAVPGPTVQLYWKSEKTFAPATRTSDNIALTGEWTLAWMHQTNPGGVPPKYESVPIVTTPLAADLVPRQARVIPPGGVPVPARDGQPAGRAFLFATASPEPSLTISAGFQQQLIDTARNGDAATLRKMLDQGIVYDGAKNPDSPTLLFFAGSPEVAEVLIGHGIDVNARNDRGQNALPILCYSYLHGAETARVLLRHGADPNAANRYGETALMAAGDGASVDALVEYGARLNAKTKDGKSGWAAMNLRSDPGYYDALVKHGLAFDPVREGPDLLARAAINGQIRLVRWLLVHHVDPNQKGDSRGSGNPGDRMLPLSAAIANWSDPYDHPDDICQLLMEHGARGSEDDVLDLAASKDQKLIQLLQQYKALPVSDLIYAILENKPSSAIQALAAKESTSLAAADFTKALYLAAYLGDLPSVELFVQKGADLTAKPSPDPSQPWLAISPLSLAAMEGHDNVVEYFLQHGVKAKFYDIANAMRPAQSDDSPHQEHYENTVRLLIAAGALKDITEDQTVLLFSSALGSMTPQKDIGIVKLLLDAGLNPNARTSDPRYKGKSAIDLVQMEVDGQIKYHLEGNSKPLLEMLKAAPISQKSGSTQPGALPAASPQVTLFDGGKSIPLSVPSQQKLAQQVEAIVRSSEIVSTRFIIRAIYVNYEPEQIKATGSYLHIVYPPDRYPIFSKDVSPVKEIFLGLADNHNGLLFHGFTGGSYPGYPGSISLVGSSGVFPYYSARSSEKNGDLLMALGLNADLHPHLAPKMKATVDSIAAVQKNDVAALKNLIARGLDVKSIAGPDGSLLGYATSPEMAELLLQQGIPVDAKDSQFQPALIHICQGDRRDRATIAPVVTVLLKHGADPNGLPKGYHGYSQVIPCAIDGPTVDALVAAGALVPPLSAWARIDGGLSPHPLPRSLDYYQALVRHGLDLKDSPWCGSQGLSVLLCACEVGGRDDLVQWLINQGVDPDAFYYFGDYPKGLPKTALIQCAESGNVATAKLLLQYGLNLDQVVRDGKTESQLALEVAQKTNNPEFISLLQAAEANKGTSPNVKDAYARVLVLMVDFPESDYQANRRAIDDAVHQGDFTTLQNLFHSQPSLLRPIDAKFPIKKWGHTTTLVTGPASPALTFSITPSRDQDKIHLVGSMTVNHKHWYDRPDSNPSLKWVPMQTYPLDATLPPREFQAIPEGGILESPDAREPGDQKPYRLFLFFSASAHQQPSPDASNHQGHADQPPL